MDQQGKKKGEGGEITRKNTSDGGTLILRGDGNRLWLHEVLLLRIDSHGRNIDVLGRLLIKIGIVNRGHPDILIAIGHSNNGEDEKRDPITED